MKVQSEHMEQCLFVQWFRQTYPKIRIFAIPNGGGRSKAAGASLKAEGVSAGVPDLCIPEWNTWIEMKRSAGSHLSPEQRDWMAYLESIGQTCVVGFGWEDARNKILDKRRCLSDER